MDFSKPEALNLDGNLKENWKRFKTHFEIYATATKTDKEEDQIQVARFLSCAGAEAIELFHTFELSAEEQRKINAVKAKFEQYCNPRSNVVYERYRFYMRSQREGEPFDHFLKEISTLVESCSFGEEKKSMLRDRIVIGIADQNVQAQLLKTNDLDLDKAVDTCRIAEMTKVQSKIMQGEGNPAKPSTSVDALKAAGESKSVIDNSKSTKKFSNFNCRCKENAHQFERSKCKFCNYSHKKGNCPAFGKKCAVCGKANHFASVCQRRSQKEKSSADVLEKLETEIRTIEKYSLTTQEKQKRMVGNFLVISIGLYALGFCIVYFVFFPPTWPERITYSVPLLLFPLLIFLLRRMLAWFFQRKINKNSTKLVKLRAEKKKILEQVMEKETYNVASKLLSKYGGDRSVALKSTSLAAPTPKPSKPLPDNRNLNTSIASLSTRPIGSSLQPSTALNQSLLSAAINGQPLISPATPRSTGMTQVGSALRYRGSVTPQTSAVASYNPRPYPIINQKNQGVLEKMVDYLIGDGPQNRYALICKECFGHNGMARQEEFDYATFRCAFCNELNPSRKSRPVAPKMAVGMSPIHNRMIGLSSTNSDSSSESSEDSDASNRDKKQPSPVKTPEIKREEETLENNNEYSNSNGVPITSEESESKTISEAEDTPEIENEDEKDQEATKESETKQ